jgi:Cu/Ag efflux pump CusA
VKLPLSVAFKNNIRSASIRNKLIYYNVSAMDVANALKANNRDVGGSIYEMNRMGYMIRGLGYIKGY